MRSIQETHNALKLDGIVFLDAELRVCRPESYPHMEAVVAILDEAVSMSGGELSGHSAGQAIYKELGFLQTDFGTMIRGGLLPGFAYEPGMVVRRISSDNANSTLKRAEAVLLKSMLFVRPVTATTTAAVEKPGTAAIEIAATAHDKLDELDGFDLAALSQAESEVAILKAKLQARAQARAIVAFETVLADDAASVASDEFFSDEEEPDNQTKPKNIVLHENAEKGVTEKVVQMQGAVEYEDVGFQENAAAKSGSLSNPVADFCASSTDSQSPLSVAASSASRMAAIADSLGIQGKSQKILEVSVPSAQMLAAFVSLNLILFWHVCSGD
jgi:hypothetical protein